MQKLFTALCVSALAASGLTASAAGKLTIESATCVTPESGDLYADADQMISGLVYSLTLKNAGDEDLVPGDENYSVTLFQTTKNVNLATVELTETLAPGSSMTVEMAWPTFSIQPLIDAYAASGDSKYWSCLGVRENTTGSTKNVMPWRDVYPYIVNYILCPEYTGTEVNATINFGFVEEATTLTYRVRAQGAADVNVTSITVPEGFSVSPAAPFTVPGMLQSDASHFVNLEITFDPSKSGSYAGAITLEVEGADSKSYTIQGAMIGENDYYEDFTPGEGENTSTYVPTGWILGSNWSGFYNSGGSGDTKYYLQHSSSMDSGVSLAITPKLSFEDGGALMFEAARRSYDSRLEVMYSPDRANWTPLCTIVPNGTDGQLSFPSSANVMGSYNVTLPEGEWYIGFKGKYILLNNVFGGQLANVEHDVMFIQGSIPSKGTANNPINVSETFKNLNGVAEGADTYTVELVVNGEAVKTLEAPEWEAGSTLTFETSFTPNFAGDYTVEIRISFGEGSVSSPTQTVKVNAETSSMDLTIGTQTGTNTMAPFRTNWNNSASETRYPQEYLARYGLGEGMMISGITFEGTSTSTKTWPAKIQIWLQNEETNNELYALTPEDAIDLSTITPVYVDDNFTYEITGTYSDPCTFIMECQLAEPFEYTGGNLFMATMSEAEAYAAINFPVCNELHNNVLYHANDNHDTFVTQSWSTSGNGSPVMLLQIAKEAMTISGVISGASNTADAESVPVADATVTITADDVLYTTVTDASGAYSMEVFQPERTYTLTVEADDYQTYTEEGITFDANVVCDVTLEPVKTGVEEISALNGVRLASGLVTDRIEIEGCYNPAVVVVAADGSVVAKGRGNVMNVSNLSAGVYIVSVETEQGNKALRFIKK